MIQGSNINNLLQRTKFLISGWTIVLGISCSSIQGKKASSDSNDGIFWAIDHRGENKTSYLLGSIHSMDTNFVKLPISQLEDSARQSEMICLETIAIGDEVRNKRGISNEFFLLKDTTKNISNQLDSLTLNKLKEIIRSADEPVNLMGSMLHRINPAVLTFLITSTRQTHSAYYKEHNFSIEDHFSKFGEKNAIQLIGLEEPGSTLQALFGNGETKFAENLAVLQSSIDNYNTDSIDIYENYILQKNEYLQNEGVLDPRNAIIAGAIDSLLEKKRLFIILGAAHLPGKSGVLNQLAEKGHKVRRVKIEISK